MNSRSKVLGSSKITKAKFRYLELGCLIAGSTGFIITVQRPLFSANELPISIADFQSLLLKLDTAIRCATSSIKHSK